ncbi:transglutaminase-like domain-containing protein [Microbacterium luticocti]|uniref:transglutaminase-like domain-containing protein n=1 Tax=Microbacterium luticocti TaxID=451764 RepID=UPI000425000B|nr:transglutaminase family protein [Microbacterium luticocti]
MSRRRAGSAVAGRTPRRTRRTPRAGGGWDAAALRGAHVATGTGYALAMAAVAAVAAWPIYADLRFAVLAAVAVLAAMVVSVAATLWRWPGWLTALAAVGAFVLLGVTIAVPPASPAGILSSLRDVAAGAVLGWKDLVTVDLPVGGYRNLLVPAVVVFLGGTLAVLRLGWRPARIGAAAAPIALSMTGFGLLFGRTVTSFPLTLGPVTVPAPREMACGAAALVFSLAWLSWRLSAARREALRRAAGTSGVRVSRRRTGSDLRRGALAAGMVAVAVAVGAVLAPAVAEGRTRDVLRTGAGPEQAISRAITPLTDYRANFTDAAFTSPLFTVTALDGALPDRIRLATLSQYDGTSYRVADGGAQFVRVPSRLSVDPGRAATVRIDIGGLRGIWLPTFGSLAQVRFAGADAASHADAFYYDAAARAGVQTDGVHAGEQYEVTATTAAPPALETLRAPGAAPQVTVPESVKTWVEKQDAGADGAALATLVKRLRERGYLSHALSVPAAGAAWTRALGDGYVFQPSTAGHSLARIDTMFRRLLSAEDAGASPVAAIGDDEQFAVAVAVIAEQLGFPARVVVGARLTPVDDDTPACRDGVCTGGDLTAWTEVRAATGDWVPIDVTPQHTEGAENTVARQRDPENPTDVRPRSAQQVEPPDPTRQESNESGRHPDDGASLEGLWVSLRIAGLSALGVLLVVGPFGVILLAKVLRRRSRRQAPQPAERITGGWEEYVDAAVDHGLPAPGTQTRSEVAAGYATAHAAVLAAEADRAVFAASPPAADDAERFWAIVDQERRSLREALPLWRRALAAVSLTSFARGLRPRADRTRRGRDRNPRGEDAQRS